MVTILEQTMIVGSADKLAVIIIEKHRNGNREKFKVLTRRQEEDIP